MGAKDGKLVIRLSGRFLPPNVSLALPMPATPQPGTQPTQFKCLIGILQDFYKSGVIRPTRDAVATRLQNTDVLEKSGAS